MFKVMAACQCASPSTTEVAFHTDLCYVKVAINGGICLTKQNRYGFSDGAPRCSCCFFFFFSLSALCIFRWSL